MLPRTRSAVVATMLMSCWCDKPTFLNVFTMQALTKAVAILTRLPCSSSAMVSVICAANMFARKVVFPVRLQPSNPEGLGGWEPPE